MRYRVVVPLLAVALVLQPFLDSLLPWELAPKMIVSAGIIACLVYEPSEVLPLLITGSVAELLSDMASAQFVGFSVIGFVIILSLAIFVRQFINVNNFIVVAGIYLVMIPVYYAIMWGLYRIAGSPYSFIYAMSSIPAAVAGNFIFGMILYFILKRRRSRRGKDGYFK